MCGRAYETYTEEELELRYQITQRKQSFKDFRPNFNLAPTQLSPVVLIRGNHKDLDFFRWGLIPFWAKDPKSAAKYSLINAKAEEITEKRSFKTAFEKRRCLVPVSGFYEWKRMNQGPKQPYAIHLKNEPIMSLAGVWEHWKSKETQEEIYSFSIITCEANSLLKTIHDRMPVILDPKHELEWLDPKNQDLKNLKMLLNPCPEEWLEFFKISNAVNSPKNNSKDILNPI